MTRATSTLRWGVNLADELIATQQYLEELGRMMARSDLDSDLLLFRCGGCGRLREVDSQWTQRYCDRACQQRAYRLRLRQRQVGHQRSEVVA